MTIRFVVRLLHPLATSHSSMLQLQYHWQSVPNEGYGHSTLKSSPVYPGKHSVAFFYIYVKDLRTC